MRVLLASKSPRRKELLKELIENFEVKVFPTDENFLGESPQATVKEIALRKLNAVEDKNKYDLIIASDTLVFKDGVYYGKPKDREDAIRMLSELEGKHHLVCSAIALYYNGEIETHAVTTKVIFNDMSLAEIERYVDNYNCLDKAGAYAVQDGVVVKEFEGSYSNVVGLPLEKLSEILKGKKII